MPVRRVDTNEDCRWVLVTGVEHPTARALASELATRWAIVTHSFSLNAAQAAADDILHAGGNAHPVEADLTVAATTARMYCELRTHGPPVTALVHGASLPGPESTAHALNRIHPSDWYRFTHLHLAMLLHTIHGAVETIDTRTRSGAILTVTSPAASRERATPLARATIDGATAAFTTALGRENRDPSLAVRHLNLRANTNERGSGADVVAYLNDSLHTTATVTSQPVIPDEQPSR